VGNWARDGQRGWASTTYVGSDLTQALVTNPHLRIEVENGYYDLATPFFRDGVHPSTISKGCHPICAITSRSSTTTPAHDVSVRAGARWS